MIVLTMWGPVVNRKALCVMSNRQDSRLNLTCVPKLWCHRHIKIHHRLSLPAFTTQSVPHTLLKGSRLQHRSRRTNWHCNQSQKAAAQCFAMAQRLLVPMQWESACIVGVDNAGCCSICIFSTSTHCMNMALDIYYYIFMSFVSLPELLWLLFYLIMLLHY